MIAIAGGKGGCGKTTTTLGLASALVRQRKPALAADADREMPDLHALAGVSREPGLDAVAAGWPPGLVAGRADAPVGGVAVVPAASGRPTRRQPSEHRQSPPEHFQSRSARRQSPPEHCPTPPEHRPSPLARLRGVNASVLLDCPAGAGPDAVAPLRVAEAVLLVTTPEPACLRDAAKTAAMVRELGTPVAGAVVSRADEPPAGVPRLLDCPVLETVSEVGPAERPLADQRVRAAHDRLLSGLQPKYL